MSGASITIDIALPLLSGGKISPMIAGLSTFDATAQPVRKRAKINVSTLSLNSVITIPQMKSKLATLKTG